MFKLFKSGKNKLAIGMLAVVMTLSLSVVAQGASTANGTNIRFRSEPNLDDKYIIRELDKDEQVNILDVNGEWLKVEVSGVVGYVNSKYIKIDETKNATIIDGPTKIRRTPSLANELNVVPDIRLNAGDRVYVMSQAGNFYCIEFNNQVYYVHTTLILLDSNKEQVEQEQQITDEQIAQNVQEEVEEEIVEIKEEIKSITTESIVSSEYVVGDTIYTLVNQLNFRNSMDLSDASKKNYKLSAGTPLTVLEIYPQWVKVSTLSGDTGFVSRDYVTKSQGNYGVVDQARMLLGIPYAQYYNNVSMDCSGLIYYVYHVLNGVSIPRCSYEQARVSNYKEAYEVSFENLMPGDLVFFYGGCSHVGLYIGNGEFIQAENYGYNSRVTKFYNDSIDFNHWGNNFTKGVRIIK